jgi:hypothetical protein
MMGLSDDDNKQEGGNMEVEAEDGFMHSLIHCQKRRLLTQVACDDFRRGIKYAIDSHSCFKCGFSQKLCVTGKEEGIGKANCQWANVLIPVVLGAMVGGEEGFEVIQRAGFRGKSDDWEGYRSWLGLRHERLIWGQVMSNAMAVVIDVIIYIANL